MFGVLGLLARFFTWCLARVLTRVLGQSFFFATENTVYSSGTEKYTFTVPLGWINTISQLYRDGEKREENHLLTIACNYTSRVLKTSLYNIISKSCSHFGTYISDSRPQILILQTARNVHTETNLDQICVRKFIKNRDCVGQKPTEIPIHKDPERAAIQFKSSIGKTHTVCSSSGPGKSKSKSSLEQLRFFRYEQKYKVPINH